LHLLENLIIGYRRALLRASRSCRGKQKVKDDNCSGHFCSFK
jgi:hypothetical protein